MTSLKILGKLDDEYLLFKKEKPFDLEKSFSFLEKELEKISSNYNQVHGSFLEQDGRLKIVGRDEKLQKEVVAVKEELYKRKKSFPELAELAISVYLHKIIADRFLVLRSSQYDDYENGVDNVLVDKTNGLVICGFDQVLGRDSDDGAQKKEAKVRRINERGGAYLEHGPQLDSEGKISIRKKRNIPAFFLGINKRDLIFLVENLSNNKPLDNKILKNILNSLEKQEDDFTGNLLKNKDDKFIEALTSFKDLLKILREKVEHP